MRRPFIRVPPTRGLTRLPADLPVGDSEIAAGRSQLYAGLKDKMVNETGHSSAAAGWSGEILVERWSLPPTRRFVNTMVRHRLVVLVGSRPVVVRWNDDGCVGMARCLPGAVNLMPQGLTSVTQWDDSLGVVSFEFSSSLIDRLLDGHAPTPSEQFTGVRNASDPAAFDLTRRVMAELEKPTERLYGELLCLGFAVHLLRRYGRGSTKALRSKARLSSAQASCVLEYIQANLDGRLTLASLARQVGISECHFARAFRATFNEAPHRLILRWRLERAVRLVSTGVASLAEAAVAVGFCDQAHFTHAMRRHFGNTPGHLLRL